MKTKVFAVFDSKVGCYMSPFYARSAGEAVRSFGDAIADPKTVFASHPGDFTLFEIGEYNEDNGELKGHTTKINLGTALELSARSPREGAPVDAGAPDWAGLLKAKREQAETSKERAN